MNRTLKGLNSFTWSIPLTCSVWITIYCIILYQCVLLTLGAAPAKTLQSHPWSPGFLHFNTEQVWVHSSDSSPNQTTGTRVKLKDVFSLQTGTSFCQSSIFFCISIGCFTDLLQRFFCATGFCKGHESVCQAGSDQQWASTTPTPNTLGKKLSWERIQY